MSYFNVMFYSKVILYFKAVCYNLQAPWCGSARRGGPSCSHCPSRRPIDCWQCRCCCTAAAAQCGRTRRPPLSSWPFTSDTPRCQLRHVNMDNFRRRPADNSEAGSQEDQQRGKWAEQQCTNTEMMWSGRPAEGATVCFNSWELWETCGMWCGLVVKVILKQYMYIHSTPQQKNIFWQWLKKA